MFRTMRLAGLQIALAAMVLRALLPAGWMPGQSADVPLVICTMDGAVHAPAQPGHPIDRSDRDHQLCPFAAAVHLAVAVNAIALPASQEFGRALASVAHAARIATGFTPYSSRGPPSLV